VDSDRVPMDLASYERRIRTGGCFVCGIVRRDPDYAYEEIVFDDGAHIAFLDRFRRCTARCWWHPGRMSSMSFAS
jgi:histidine triad (HIT) family protein